MNGHQDKSDRTNSSPNAKHDETADDRWLADLPNDLAAMSLSSDEVPPLHPGMMRCIEEVTTAGVSKAHHKHQGVGL